MQRTETLPAALKLFTIQSADWLDRPPPFTGRAMPIKGMSREATLPASVVRFYFNCSPTIACNVDKLSFARPSSASAMW